MGSMETERRHSHLLGAISLLLVGSAALSVYLNLAGDGFRYLTPGTVNLSVLILALCSVALVWDKERTLRAIADQADSDRILTAAFHNRLQALEVLLDASDRLNAPLTVNEVVKLVLRSAQELSGAVGGSVVVFGGNESEPMLTESHLPVAPKEELPNTREITLPLEHQGRKVAELTLLVPERNLERDRLALQVLQRLAGEAAATLTRTMEVEREKESFTFLEAARLVKSRFLSTVSHELRTPLTSIIGFTGTLDHHWERMTDTEKRESVQAVHRQSHKLWRMVERILEAARVELEGIAVNPVEHDITRSIRSSLQSFLDTDPERLRIDVPLDPTIVEIDPVILEQCLWNLVDNSLRYTEGMVTITLEAGPEVVAVRVHDQGDGISDEVLARSVDPLARPQRDSDAGTGLGLHVVQTLMADHGGALTIDRVKGGMVASLNFPVRAPARRAPRYMRVEETERKKQATAH